MNEAVQIVQCPVCNQVKEPTGNWRPPTEEEETEKAITGNVKDEHCPVCHQLFGANERR